MDNAFFLLKLNLLYKNTLIYKGSWGSNSYKQEGVWLVKDLKKDLVKLTGNQRWKYVLVMVQFQDAAFDDTHVSVPYYLMPEEKKHV